MKKVESIDSGEKWYATCYRMQSDWWYTLISHDNTDEID